MKRKYLLLWIALPLILLAFGAYAIASGLGVTTGPLIEMCNELQGKLPPAKEAFMDPICAKARATVGLNPPAPIMGPNYHPIPPVPPPGYIPGGPLVGVSPQEWLAQLEVHGYWLPDYNLGTLGWQDGNNIVLAGQLSTDPQQGVIVLAETTAGKLFPAEVGAYLTSGKDGPLAIFALNGIQNPGWCVDNGVDKNCPPPTPAGGNVLTLRAADGAIYTFNVNTRTLSRQ